VRITEKKLKNFIAYNLNVNKYFTNVLAKLNLFVSFKLIFRLKTFSIALRLEMVINAFLSIYRAVGLDIRYFVVKYSIFNDLLTQMIIESLVFNSDSYIRKGSLNELPFGY